MSVNSTTEQCMDEAQGTGRLFLSQKNLRDFPEVSDDCELIDVKAADLSRNRFAEFPEELCDFIMLERLNLYHNMVRLIPPSVSRLKSLTTLKLRRNQIVNLPAAFCQLPLRVLDLSNNKLSALPVEIGLFTLLHDLDLSSNELTHLPSTVGEMISLKDLNVRRNMLVALPDELSKLKLIKLDFSCNKVSVIPPAYRLITTLTSLELAHNPLSSPPAQICTKGRLHIFKYLSVAAQQQEMRHGLDRDVKRYSAIQRSGLNHESVNDSMLIRRTQSFEFSNVGFQRHLGDEDVYSPRSLREKDKTRAPLNNMFGSDEKRREIQKEIERAQMLIAESEDGEEEEDGIRPDEDQEEGAELQKAFLQIEIDERKRVEEEGAEERRQAAKKLQEDQELLQKQKIETRRRAELQSSNGVAECRKPVTSSKDKKETSRIPLPSSPSKNIGRKPAMRGRLSSEENSSRVVRRRQEEETRTKNREVLMQQSRREAQLSRLRLEEERLKTRQQQQKDAQRHGGGLSFQLDNEASKDKQEHTKGKSGQRHGGGLSFQLDNEASKDKQEHTKGKSGESVYSHIQQRKSIAQARSLPRSFKGKEASHFTMKRMYDSAREEFEQLEILREAIESSLKVTLPDDLPASLADGVVLCHLVNTIKKGTIISIHIPSAGVPKLTMPKCQKNVDSFIDACKTFGVRKDKLCTPSDILAEKSPTHVCQTVLSLLECTGKS